MMGHWGAAGTCWVWREAQRWHRRWVLKHPFSCPSAGMFPPSCAYAAMLPPSCGFCDLEQALQHLRGGTGRREHGIGTP
eukprot:1161736-Pelagomonas_calceolata.AAC.7